MTSQTARAPEPQTRILLREMVGSIAVLTLNRPAARNSLSEGLIAELHGALKDIHDDKSIRAVVIAANGPAFSAAAGLLLFAMSERAESPHLARLPAGGIFGRVGQWLRENL